MSERSIWLLGRLLCCVGSHDLMIVRHFTSIHTEDGCQVYSLNYRALACLRCGCRTIQGVVAQKANLETLDEIDRWLRDRSYKAKSNPLKIV